MHTLALSIVSDGSTYQSRLMHATNPPSLANEEKRRAYYRFLLARTAIAENARFSLSWQRADIDAALEDLDAYMLDHAREISDERS